MKRAMTISTYNIADEMTRKLISIVQSCLRPEQHQDAYDEFFDEFFDTCMRGLIAHDEHADKIHGRLKPSRN